MEYIRNTTGIMIKEPTVLSLGKFDGLHMGHKFLLSRMLEKQKQGLAAVMFTFDIPPKTLVSREALSVLTTNEEKEYIFAKTGIDYLIEYPFTQKVRSLTPEMFLRYLVERLNVKCIVAGRDFRFGYNRRGNYETLERMGPELGFEAVIVDKMEYEHREISSTFIREEIAKGNLEKANYLLGYDYFVTGTVVHGRALGRTLGIPTVNLIPPQEKQLPPFGVYVSRVLLKDGRIFGGITNVGKKPTIKGENPIGIETHILDFKEDLYDRSIEVRFLKFLRSEQKFSSVEELTAQMRLDVEQGREYLVQCKKSQ